MFGRFLFSLDVNTYIWYSDPVNYVNYTKQIKQKKMEVKTRAVNEFSTQLFEVNNILKMFFLWRNPFN